jgi:hypothetical protein
VERRRPSVGDRQPSQPKARASRSPFRRRKSHAHATLDTRFARSPVARRTARRGAIQYSPMASSSPLAPRISRRCSAPVHCLRRSSRSRGSIRILCTNAL